VLTGSWQLNINFRLILSRSVIRLTSRVGGSQSAELHVQELVQGGLKFQRALSLLGVEFG
jgi:hypothetical protein